MTWDGTGDDRGGPEAAMERLKEAVTLICRAGFEPVCCVTAAVIRERILWLPPSGA